MKKIFFFAVLCLSCYSASAQHDTTRTSDRKSGGILTIGLQADYFPLSNFNSKLFGSDKGAYLANVQTAGTVSYSFRIGSVFYGLGYTRGGDEEVTDKNYARMEFSNSDFHMGYNINESKPWSFTSSIAFGWTSFTINSYAKINPISFDSLLRQSATTGEITRSIDLVSDYNFYLEPKIGIIYKVPAEKPGYPAISFGLIGGYRLYSNGVSWHTAGGQPLNNMPMNFSGIPSLEFVVRYEFLKQ
jgi:hypothetical protein